MHQGSSGSFGEAGAESFQMPAAITLLLHATLGKISYQHGSRKIGRVVETFLFSGHGYIGRHHLGLTYSYIGIYILLMARAATTSDAFNAVAEPRRREILDYLAQGERPVGDLVLKLKLEQPSVSKHLRVLRDVGLVRVRRNGRHMLYRTNAEGIRPLHEWTKTIERMWAHQLLRIKERAEEKAKDLKSD